MSCKRWLVSVLTVIDASLSSFFSETSKAFSVLFFGFTIRALHSLIAVSLSFDLLVFLIAVKGDYSQP